MVTLRPASPGEVSAKPEEPKEPKVPQGPKSIVIGPQARCPASPT
jgi:hypothetical protein